MRKKMKILKAHISIRNELNMTDSTILRPIETTDADCFACGTDNPCGLHMEFETDGQALYSRVVLPGRMRGWRNMAHGGIISTMLDEIMAWTAIHLLQRFILTQSIRVDFLKPVTIETPLLVKGWVKERVSPRKAIMTATVSDDHGQVLAKAEGEFALFKHDSPVLERILPKDAAGKRPRIGPEEREPAAG